ncbi:hypothetical protein [Streptomyces sennicomposti]
MPTITCRPDTSSTAPGSGLRLARTGPARTLPVLLAVSAASAGAVAPFLRRALQTRLSAFPTAARRRLMALGPTVIRSGGTTSLSRPRRRLPPGRFPRGGLATVTVSALGAAAVRWWSRGTGAPPVVETAWEPSSRE